MKTLFTTAIVLVLVDQVNSACIPRNDVYGHFKCNQSGEKFCRDTWTNIVKNCLDSCINIADSVKSDCGYHGIGQQQCTEKGCCWAESQKKGTPWCFHGLYLPPPPSPKPMTSPIGYYISSSLIHLNTIVNGHKETVSTQALEITSVLLKTADIPRITSYVDHVFSASAHTQRQKTSVHQSRTHQIQETPIISSQNISPSSKVIIDAFSGMSGDIETTRSLYSRYWTEDSNSVKFTTSSSKTVSFERKTVTTSTLPKSQPMSTLTSTRSMITTATTMTTPKSEVVYKQAMFFNGAISETSFFIIITLTVVLVFFMVFCIVLYKRNTRIKTILRKMYEAAPHNRITTSDKLLTIENDKSHSFDNPTYDCDNFAINNNDV